MYNVKYVEENVKIDKIDGIKVQTKYSHTPHKFMLPELQICIQYDTNTYLIED